jgi:hypothetical protein
MLFREIVSMNLSLELPASPNYLAWGAFARQQEGSSAIIPPHDRHWHANHTLHKTYRPHDPVGQADIHACMANAGCGTPSVVAGPASIVWILQIRKLT